MTQHFISATALAKYTQSPSTTTVANAKSLQESIRSVLGSDYETFLQGSYKNDTGVPDLNDVDVVAIRKSTLSAVFTPGTVVSNPITWDRIFAELQERLESSHHYRGKTEIGDKCVKVHNTFKADVVPAVRIGDDYSADPIAVYSFRERSERKNYPRLHARKNNLKHQATNETYKPTVRMFKRWVRNWFPNGSIAPSFYVECLIHGVPNNRFSADPAISFYLVSDWIIENVDRATVVMSVAGDKDILTESEWAPGNFTIFANQLSNVRPLLLAALQATSETDASRLWRGVFNER